ncbi:hypothetical protein CPB86DRAFT_793658 [Serendipita vermifera]|nr:hypothetical protein CPB86DRAFT_793658 [Serendipita vermifera]
MADAAVLLQIQAVEDVFVSTDNTLLDLEALAVRLAALAAAIQKNASLLSQHTLLMADEIFERCAIFASAALKIEDTIDNAASAVSADVASLLPSADLFDSIGEGVDDEEDGEIDWVVLKNWLLSNIAFPFPELVAAKLLPENLSVDLDEFEYWASHVRARSGWDAVFTHYANCDERRMGDLCQKYLTTQPSEPVQSLNQSDERACIAFLQMLQAIPVVCTELEHERQQPAPWMDKLEEMIAKFSLDVVEFEDLSNEELDSPEVFLQSDSLLGSQTFLTNQPTKHRDPLEDKRPDRSVYASSKSNLSRCSPSSQCHGQCNCPSPHDGSDKEPSTLSTPVLGKVILTDLLSPLSKGEAPSTSKQEVLSPLYQPLQLLAGFKRKYDDISESPTNCTTIRRKSPAAPSPALLVVSDTQPHHPPSDEELNGLDGRQEKRRRLTPLVPSNPGSPAGNQKCLPDGAGLDTKGGLSPFATSPHSIAATSPSSSGSESGSPPYSSPSPKREESYRHDKRQGTFANSQETPGTKSPSTDSNPALSELPHQEEDSHGTEVTNQVQISSVEDKEEHCNLSALQAQISLERKRKRCMYEDSQQSHSGPPDLLHTIPSMDLHKRGHDIPAERYRPKSGNLKRNESGHHRALSHHRVRDGLNRILSCRAKLEGLGIMGHNYYSLHPCKRAKLIHRDNALQSVT